MVLSLALALPALAQDPTPPPGPPEYPLRTPEELSQMLAPIAIYPDPLISELLPAATFPEEIVVADRYLAANGDPNLIDQQPWDASVQALARYPAVLKYLDDNLAWTTAVGQAFLAQPDDVMQAIQSLRAQAVGLGNLQTTPEARVVIDEGLVEIQPVDPGLLFVPVYDPGIIFYQRAYGQRFLTFMPGYRTGRWLDHDFDWHNHRVIVWSRDHPRPAGWWAQAPSRRSPEAVRTAGVWQPKGHSVGVAPGHLDRGWAPAGLPHGQETRPGARPGSPPVVIHSQPRGPVGGGIGGNQTAHEARQTSARGQASRQVARPTPAAPAHAAPPPPRPAGGGGGGGGGRGRQP